MTDANEEVWLLNPAGMQVSVAPSRARELVTKGYALLRRDEVIAYKTKTPIDARIVDGQWYYSGYGRVQELLDNNISWNPESKNLIHIGHPQSIVKNPGERHILITAFEANIIPPFWVPLLEQYELVLVPSRFCERIFKDSGAKTQFRVMIQGTDNFRIAEPKAGDFYFLHYNSFSDNGRKGWDLVAKVFDQLFPPSINGVKLILKSRKHDVQRDIAILPRNKNIQIIVEDYNRRQMDALLSSVHCMVFPSRGEGIGLTPIETIAKGIPTIYTDAYGMTEYEQFGIGIDVQGFTPAIYDFNFDGMWVEPSEDKLREKMISVYKHYSEHRKTALEKHSKFKEKFGERAMIRKFEELMAYV